MKRFRLGLSDEALLRLTLAALIVGGLIAYFAENIFIAVPAGHVGVLWSRFFGGTVTNHVYGEGMHLFFPWDRVRFYDVRAKNFSQTVESITRDGLEISLTLEVRYHLIIDQVGLLQQAVGDDYEQSLLKPTAVAFARGQIARYTAEEVYLTQRSYLERVVLDFLRLNRTLIVRSGLNGVSFLNYDAVFLNKIELPAIVRNAIEHKVAQLQALQEWGYRVQREQLESDRRLIEARTSRTVLDLLGNRLTDTFVRLRYVEVLERLSAFPNTKVIITGPGNGGVPVIVGTDGAPAPAFAQPGAADTGTAASPPSLLRQAPVPPVGAPATQP